VKTYGIAPARHRSRSGEAGGSLYLVVHKEQKIKDFIPEL
jgi:hypothetical protein